MAEKTIKTLKEQNATLMDRVDDLENRSRRANLRILNVPENSEKGQSTVKFMSEMLMEVMGQEVFEKPPELLLWHSTEAVFFTSRPRPYFSCLLPCLVSSIERLSLHGSPN